MNMIAALKRFEFKKTFSNPTAFITDFDLYIASVICTVTPAPKIDTACTFSAARRSCSL